MYDKINIICKKILPNLHRYSKDDFIQFQLDDLNLLYKICSIIINKPLVSPGTNIWYNYIEIKDLIYDTILNKLINNTNLFVLFDQKTNLPFLAQNKLYVFTSEDKAKIFLDKVKQINQNWTFKIVYYQYVKQFVENMRDYFGIKEIIVNNDNDYHLYIKSSLFLNLLSEKTNVGYSNIKCNKKLLQYLQIPVKKDENYMEIMKKKKQSAFKSLFSSYLLMPVYCNDNNKKYIFQKDKTDKNYNIIFYNEQKTIPIFTDIYQFKQINYQYPHKLMLVSLKDILSYKYQVIINPVTMNIKIKNSN